MKKIVSACVFQLVLSSGLWATWALIPLDELIKDTGLIVIGTLNSAQEDYEGIGRGYISVDSVITSGATTWDNKPLANGDNIKITWADNWACAGGMHLGWQGTKGIWLLKIKDNGTVVAGYPGRFISIEELYTIRELLGRQKEIRSVAVDISDVDSHSQLREPESAQQINKFDTTEQYSMSRASFVLSLFVSLYWILYKTRFRIR